LFAWVPPVLEPVRRSRQRHPLTGIFYSQRNYCNYASCRCATLVGCASHPFQHAFKFVV
jgi:hypothetical protein